ncbi:hypothetical protein TVAG_294920 [Trichomonas vaginalis G3]|uniref:Uncharacterized protein n=1 Tax=Trichomonas vaginalis (strain ATCC PRA-98 / G3) TaxID=412133 RepID=A2DL49_TRIV3|nr:ankyrin repeat protein family [Trichomonas vaginalis G3]EAY18840.1 hypothetical protein TVAG_294920 [Trichomonas vaginalis G3]KAI5526054.1 ankyrin repeat protein family [Trichomonas vaginalis G3]|eukprot:XP_001579826.1 hypothetical protein [Trichomonas vaginalis G3]
MKNFCNKILLKSCEKGNLKLLKYLIECGINKESKNKNGTTPLIYASINSHFEVVKYLISIRADKKAKDNKDKTALDLAKDNVKSYLEYS